MGLLLRQASNLVTRSSPVSQESPNTSALTQEFDRYLALLDKRDSEQEVPWSRPMAIGGSWEIREHYAIEDGVLIGSGEVQSIYFPASKPEILQDLQRLRTNPDATDDEKAILAFARRWGSLGYSELQAETTGEPASWEGLFPPTNDPIDWFMWHSISVQFAATILAQVREDLPDNRPTPQDYIPNPFTFAARERLLEWDYIDKPLPTLSGTKNTLLSVVNHMVRRNVSGIHIDPNARFESKKLETGLEFTALIEVIWWHLLKLGESPILKACPACGSIFPATRTNQVYCPIPWYSSGTVSPCSARLRMRAYRETKRTKEAG